MKWNNKSQIITSVSEQQKADQFYKLHYPLRQAALSPQRRGIGVRAKSFNTVTPHINTQKMLRQYNNKNNRNVVDHVLTRDPLSAEQKLPSHKQSGFSFQKWLSKRVSQTEMKDYFYKNMNRELSVQEYSTRNMGVRLAVQKQREQKVKIQKVLQSHKQSQEVKLNYLQLKRKQTEQEIRNEIRMMYEQFFRKEYEQVGGEGGFHEFERKMRTAMEMLHQQMFSK